MGYIFDALNKNSDEKPQAKNAQADTPEVQAPEAAQPPAEQTQTAPEQPEPTRAEHDPAPAPIRLADVKLALDAENEAGGVAEIRAVLSPTEAKKEKPVKAAAPQPAPVEVQPANTEPLQIHTHKPARKTGWWQRFLGKHIRGNHDDRLVSMTRPASAVAEEYRSLRTSILARHDNERNIVHTITSATPQEGKTITSVNLGLSFAELRNRKTIIVECDLRLPTFGKLLDCDTQRPGLISYLRGEASLNDVIQEIEGSSLHVLPAGGRVSDEAVQLISSTRMTGLIQSLRAKYDHVIIDTPPVVQLADAGILGSQSEEVLLVARMRRTPRTLIEQAVATLDSYNALVNGIIATDNPRSRGRGYKYGYKYGYGYSYGYTSENRKQRNARDAA